MTVTKCQHGIATGVYLLAQSFLLVHLFVRQSIINHNPKGSLFTIYLFLLIIYQLPPIVPTQVPAINFLFVSNLPHVAIPSIITCPQQSLTINPLIKRKLTRCFQSESAGRMIFSCSGPPYRFLSKDKLARSANVTAVPDVTPVHRNALNGSGICANAGNLRLASNIPPNPTTRPAAAPLLP